MAWTRAQVAVHDVIAGTSVVRAIGSVARRRRIVTLPSSLFRSGPASLGTITPRTPMTPVTISISGAVAIWTCPSVVANALPRVVDTLAMLAAPIGHALSAVLTGPAGLAPTLFRNMAETMFWMTSLFADRLFARDAFVFAEAFALEWFVDAAAVMTVQSRLANGAVRTTPSRMTGAHSGHDAFPMHAVRTRGFVARHADPSWFTDALEASVAMAVDAARKWNALFAELTPPTDFAVTGEGFGAVAVDAGSVVDLAHRRLAQVVRISPSWKTPHLAVTVTVVSTTLLQVFSYASEFVAFVEWSVVRFGID